MAEITCRGLTLGYENIRLVTDLNFEVNQGDYLCIVGENGSGKSTLMRTLLSLQSPLDGEIVLGDGLKATEIGYLPQQTMIQRDFPASVREIVLSGCQSKKGFHPFYSKTDKDRARENMARLDIDKLSRRCYRELSGGQQQRVLLARALCATERLLLLDEPVSGLDPRVTEEMYQLIKQLNDEGITIIMISHDIGASLKYASHILHIGGGDVFFGKKEDYLKSSAGKEYAGYDRNDL